MGTVTGLTAERMLEIEAEAIVGATLSGDNLILEKHDGTTINAGSVRGPIGPSGLSLADLTQLSVLDVGMPAQVRAGHQLSTADFTALCGFATPPIALFNLSDVSSLGSDGRALTNKNGIGFVSGILGIPTTAALFTGDASKALYLPDSGSNDPLALRLGSIGCWFRTSKRGVEQALVTKSSPTSGDTGWGLYISDTNRLSFRMSIDGTAVDSFNVDVDICDDRWHFAVLTNDAHTVRLFVDNQTNLMYDTGRIHASVGPFNIGSKFADGSTAGTTPFFGRIDEAFVTADVLSSEQIRLLRCAKIPHGYSAVPKMAVLNVHRRKKGANLVSADFPSQPLRLYNLGDLADLGSNNVPLTANVGSAPGFIYQAPGPDGAKTSARFYDYLNGTHAGDSGTDAGLPSGLSSRSYGFWVKALGSGVSPRVIMCWGTMAAADASCGIDVSTGALNVHSGSDTFSVGNVADGLWHHVVIVEDNSAVDGKRKAYVDGALLGTSDVMNPITLAGADSFRIGARQNGSMPLSGLVSRAFVHSAVLTTEQIRALYYKGTQDLGVGPKDPGAYISAFDASSIYATFDSLEGQSKVNLSVAA